jgi:hypothetical protein
LQGQLNVTSFSFDSDVLSGQLQDLGWPLAGQASEQGRAQGLAQGNVSFLIGNEGELDYRVQLEITSARFDLPDGETLVEQVNGRLTIDESKAALSQFEAQLASGALSGDAMFDLMSPEGSGSLNLRYSGIELPVDWQIADSLSKLTGVAAGEMRATFRRQDDQWEVRGSGSARVAQAVFDGLAFDTLAANVDLQSWTSGTPLPQAAIGQIGVDFAADNFDLEQLATKYLPPDDARIGQLEGTFSVAGQLQSPISAFLEPSRCTANVNIAADRIRIAQTACGPLATRVDLRDGQIQVDEFAVPITDGGTLKIRADFPLEAEQTSKLQLVADDLPCKAFQPYLKSQVALSGDVSATIALSVPNSAWSKPHAWQWQGAVSSPGLTAGDQTVNSLSARLHSTATQVVLSDVQGEWSGMAWRAEASYDKASPFPFAIQLHCNDINLAKTAEASVGDLPISLVGSATLQADIVGSLQPLVWKGAGTLDADTVELNEIVVSDVSLPWTCDDQRLAVENGSLGLFGGRVEFQGHVPLADPTDLHLRGQVRSLQVDQCNSLLPWDNVTLKGTPNVTFEGNHLLSADKCGGQLHVDSVSVIVGEVDLQNLAGRLDIRKDTVQVRGSARLLGGECAFDGQALLERATSALSQMRGTATLKKIRVEQIWPKIGQQEQLGRLVALGEGQFSFELDDWQSQAQGQGRVKLTGLKWENTPLVPQMTADIRLTDHDLMVDSAEVKTGRGQLRGTATLRRSTGRGTFTWQLVQLPLSEFLAVNPELARTARGKVDGEFSGTIGEVWTAKGMLRLQRGSVKGVPMTAFRVPVRLYHAPSAGRTRLFFALQSGRVASGRVKGQCELSLGGQISSEGSFELTSADLRPLAKAIPVLDDTMRGRITAKTKWVGSDLPSLTNLSGDFDVQLQNCQTLLLPGLGELKTAIGAPSAGAVTFRDTRIRGNLQRNVVEVIELTMDSDQSRIWIDGKMNSRGALDFNVVADPGSLSTINLAAAAINPLALLRRRLLFVHLGGSINSPLVQPRTDQFLAQEVMFFFLPTISLQ